jgi:hypothetical protein
MSTAYIRSQIIAGIEKEFPSYPCQNLTGRFDHVTQFGFECNIKKVKTLFAKIDAMHYCINKLVQAIVPAFARAISEGCDRFGNVLVYDDFDQMDTKKHFIEVKVFLLNDKSTQEES